MRGSWRAFLEVPGGLSAGRYPSDQWEESVEFELDLKFSILLLSGRGAVWDGEGPGVLTALCSAYFLSASVSRSRRRRPGAEQLISLHSLPLHTGVGALMKTKMKTKALQGAATLQVAMVTSTDWSSNGNPPPAGVSQSTSSVGPGGAQGPGQSTLPSGVLRSCGGKPKV